MIKISVILGVVLLIGVLFISSCAPQRFVKPLEKQQQAVNASLGGVLFDYNGTTIPMPFLTLAYGYGLNGTTTGFGAFNVTSALYGNFQMELGLTKQVLTQKEFQPAICITPVANIIYRNRDARKLYPQLALSAYWEYGKHKDLIYLSLDNWFELSRKKANNEEQENHVLFMPSIGHSFQRKKHCFTTEFRIVAPNLSNEGLVIDYKTPLNTHGACALFFGYTLKF
ncbi:MAG: hypothetical protein IPO63_02105 [Bacteroidetes bacterium]|nr:hypothetical protein [Bacteroidota bacterium]